MDFLKKTKAEIVSELEVLRARLKELEESEAGGEGADKRLSASDADYRAIFDTANDAIFVHDIDTSEILDVNQKMCEMYGYTPEEARKLNVEAISAAEPPYTQEDALRWLKKATKGEPQLFEWMAKDKHGRLFWVEVSLKCTAIAGKDRLLAIVRDITERKRAEAALREAKEQLELKVEQRTEELRRKTEEQESFTYSVSHDLQAPLRTILTLSQRILKKLGKRLESEEKKDLLDIGRAAENTNRLLEDMLAYARLGMRDFSMSDVSLKSILVDSQFEVIDDINKKKAEIRISEPLPVVRGHERTLVRLLANLISNAIKFVPPERKPEVNIEAVRSGNCVRVSVRDNGIGIAPEYQERIFRMFERLHPQHQYPGTGIGLAIAKKAVQLHGGRIGVESEPGKGTTIWFEIPA